MAFDFQTCVLIFLGATETCPRIHIDSICMFGRFMDGQIVFLHFNTVPIDVGGDDWHSQIIGLFIYPPRA